MYNNNLKKCSAPLITRKQQGKTTMRNSAHQDVIKTENSKCWLGHGKCTLLGITQSYKVVGQFLKKLNTELPHDLRKSNPTKKRNQVFKYL